MDKIPAAIISKKAVLLYRRKEIASLDFSRKHAKIG
jgi:hypothetical protein